MRVSELTRLFDYGYWANARLFPVIAQLTPEQFTQRVAGSYGSVRNTLVHMMSAEWGWLDRCGGHPRGPALKADDFPGLDDVVACWTDVERHVREFLGRLTDVDLSRAIEFTLPGQAPRTGLLGPFMQHAAIHGIHHRGQVALLLRELGVAPGNVDLLFYDFEHPGRS